MESASSPGSLGDARKKVRSPVGFWAKGKKRYGSIRSFRLFAGPSSTMPTIWRSLPFTLTHSPSGWGAGEKSPPRAPGASHREIVRAHLVVGKRHLRLARHFHVHGGAATRPAQRRAARPRHLLHAGQRRNF